MVKRGSSEGRSTVLPGIKHITSLNDTSLFSYSSLELYDISRLFCSTKYNLFQPPTRCTKRRHEMGTGGQSSGHWQCVVTRQGVQGTCSHAITHEWVLTSAFRYRTSDNLFNLSIHKQTRDLHCVSFSNIRTFSRSTPQGRLPVPVA